MRHPTVIEQHEALEGVEHRGGRLMDGDHEGLALLIAQRAQVKHHLPALMAESSRLVGSSRNMRRGNTGARTPRPCASSPPLTPRISLLPMYVSAHRWRLS